MTIRGRCVWPFISSNEDVVNGPVGYRYGPVVHGAIPVQSLATVAAAVAVDNNSVVRRRASHSVGRCAPGVNRMTPTDFARLGRMAAGKASYCYRRARRPRTGTHGRFQQGTRGQLPPRAPPQSSAAL